MSKADLTQWQTDGLPPTEEQWPDEGLGWFQTKHGHIDSCSGGSMRAGWQPGDKWCRRLDKPGPYEEKTASDEDLLTIAIGVLAREQHDEGTDYEPEMECLRRLRGDYASAEAEPAPPDPGDGWRYLESDDVKQKGDEIEHRSGDWAECYHHRYMTVAESRREASSQCYTERRRRRIARPEPETQPPFEVTDGPDSAIEDPGFAKRQMDEFLKGVPEPETREAKRRRIEENRAPQRPATGGVHDSTLRTRGREDARFCRSSVVAAVGS